MNASILFVDGEGGLQEDFTRSVKYDGFKVIKVKEPNRVLGLLKTKKPDIVVIVSFSIKYYHALDLARVLRRKNKIIPIILVVKHSSEKLAIDALKVGINDYIKVPFSVKEFIESTRKILSEQPVKRNVSSSSGIIGESAIMHEIKNHLSKIAGVESTVFITGETGTGKELVAETIHRQSPRSNKPFVCINCAALPESLVESEMFGYERGAFTGAIGAKKGKFELALGGTLFLDEIGDLSRYAQAKLLRTIENKAVYPLGGQRAVSLDVRIVAATNQNPESLMKKGKFRKDLYYRLNVARIHLPPLRDRKEDIPDIVSFGIAKLNKRFECDLKGFSDEALASLFQHDWPGNIRELNNVVEASFISCSSKKIQFTDLPPSFTKQLNFSNPYSASEKDILLAALCASRWNKSETAKKLKWNRMKVYRAMKRYNITGARKINPI